MRTYRSILVTGGTGTFGNAFARHALATSLTDRLCILSRDELKQHEMRAALHDDPRCRWFLGDVRDEDRLRRAFAGCDLVVHAAALKQVPAIEYNSEEAVKTNIQGTVNVLRAAHDARVERVVALSSDKACSPLNAYGATKLMLEKLCRAAHNARGADGPIYSVTRYGNVAGSRGSVIPVWRDLLRQGKAVTVTHLAMTRFWMRIEGAVELVLWTADHAEGGELVVPKLPSFRVADLAAAMGATEIEGTGIRPGEKLREVMVSADESEGFTDIGTHYVRYPEPREPRLPAGVAYASDTNPRQLLVDDLQRELAAIP